MNRNELFFDRPASLQATEPPESRGIARDEVRLLVSTPDGHTHTVFYDLARYLQPGDLLVINRSATLPASLPAWASLGEFVLNVSTNYGGGLWLAEPRWSLSQPGPLPLEPSEPISIAGTAARMVAPFPGLPRLWYVQSESNLCQLMARAGAPIRYGYVQGFYPLEAYQTVFARIPGSAEMPSAGRPFTPRVLAALRARGVEMAGLTLHTGVSSLEVETDTVEEHSLYPEPFHVPVGTARAVNRARSEGRRVIAVGTTVVRALEAAWDGKQVSPARGFTRRYIHPGQGVHAVDGLVSGFHDPLASHLAMLYAIAGQELIRTAYAEAVQHGYLWHEFGDSHLILPGKEG
ncbi:MAG: queuosine biosynthesis protein [Chloroflexi bacterium]|nr:MAG: queuosine biosynthesis protein [Chloroflexota bacterium]